jgi:hypothetical protein
VHRSVSNIVFPVPSSNFGTKRCLLRFLFLWLLLAFVSARATAGTDAQNLPVTSAEPGPSFAIADFDGDLRPDLASVQTERSDLTHIDCWIQLRLTATAWRSIEVVAPVGGIRLVARDVNGDKAPDLVLSTLLKQPVAILLNNGHGMFVQVGPANFPDAICNPETNWASAIRPEAVAGAVGTPPQSRSEVRPETLDLPRLPSQVDYIASPRSGFLLGCFLVSHAGRAPPSEEFHS